MCPSYNIVRKMMGGRISYDINCQKRYLINNMADVTLSIM